MGKNMPSGGARPQAATNKSPDACKPPATGPTSAPKKGERTYATGKGIGGTGKGFK